MRGDRTTGRRAGVDAEAQSGAMTRCDRIVVQGQPKRAKPEADSTTCDRTQPQGPADVGGVKAEGVEQEDKGARGPAMRNK